MNLYGRVFVFSGLVCLISADRVCLVAPNLTTTDGIYFYEGIARRFDTGKPRVYCPDGDCKIFGDSRTDVTRNLPGSYDVDHRLINFIQNRVDSKAGASIFGSIYRGRDRITDWIYNSCTDNKIFYEGVNLSPSHGQTCNGANVYSFSKFKEDFYSILYELSTEFRCLSIYTVRPENFNNSMTKSGLPGCNQGSPIGLDWYSNVKTTVTPDKPVYDSIVGLNPDATYLLPVCRYIYGDLTTLTDISKGTLPNRVAILDDRNRTIVEYENTDYIGPGTVPYVLNCTHLRITGTSSITYEGLDGPGYVGVSRLVEFTEPYSTKKPIQVVESRWSTARISDSYVQQSACERLGKHCLWYGVDSYAGMYDAEHGDMKVRGIFSDIDKPAPPHEPYGLSSIAASTEGSADGWKLMISGTKIEKMDHYLTNLGFSLTERLKKSAYLDVSASYETVAMKKRLEDYGTIGFKYTDDGIWCSDMDHCIGAECLIATDEMIVFGTGANETQYSNGTVNNNITNIYQNTTNIYQNSTNITIIDQPDGENSIMGIDTTYMLSIVLSGLSVITASVGILIMSIATYRLQKQTPDQNIYQSYQQRGIL